ncbi:unnamed protein product [Protopolystoma xenopodis]|uniref:Guanylate kinase-like domain-containing protein n=1 Tax=Protopolystoma xenopodis TaxID=117903 RepID=A0A448X745_9PLAT|nr:unnamed protein product [Protopolystoma xenopodis]
MKIGFLARDANIYETKDLVLYEEIALIPGFQRPVVCLVGARGVGRRTLRSMLIKSNPERYAPAIPRKLIRCRFVKFTG